MPAGTQPLLETDIFMNHAAYWLLDSVIERPFPVHWLHPLNKDMSMAFNKAHHGLSLAELVTALSHLCQEKHLGMFLGETFNEWNDTAVFPNTIQIRAAVRGEIEMHYVITAAGGALWEAHSHPQWDHYSVVCGAHADYHKRCESNSESLAAGSESVLEELFALYPAITPGSAIVSDSITKHTLRPWRATYWKQVAVGYMLCFATMKQEETIGPEFMKAFNRWTEIQKWYIQPHFDKDG